MFSAIEQHDFERLIAQARKFLQGGDKVKVSVRFRKRAIAHPHLGEELLEKFKEACLDIAVIDKPPKMEGRAIAMFMSPKAQKPEKADKGAKKPVKKDAPAPEAAETAEAPAEE